MAREGHTASRDIDREAAANAQDGARGARHAQKAQAAPRRA
jgi:hypothetical protein